MIHGERIILLSVAVCIGCVSWGQIVLGESCGFSWRSGDGVPTTGNVIQVLLPWDPDGTGPQEQLLIAGGMFWVSQGGAGNNIAAWNSSTWQPLDTGMDGSVWALAVYNGELIAGGDFTTAGGVTVNRIARWNGSIWQTLGTGINGTTVHALTVYNGELIAGGTFSSAGSVTAYNVARWNGSKWQSLGNSFFSGQVSALTVYNNELIVGGDFSLSTGAPAYTTAYNIARWNGSTWQVLGSGYNNGVNYYVFALAVYKGELIVGGDFWTAGGLGGVSASRIARWNGSAWQTLGTGMDGTVWALAVYNGELIAGGSFSTAGSVTVNRIARWNGSIWQAMGTGTDNVVQALTVYKSDVVAGGFFTTAGVYASRFWARWGPDPGCPQYPPVISLAASRKTHGSAGSFDIDIRAAGAVESRRNGTTTIVVTFDQAVQGVGGLDITDVSVRSGTVSNLAINGSELTVTMSGATNAEALVIGFPGISGVGGLLVADTLCLGILEGDVSGDSKVNVFDLLQTKNQVNQPVVAGNFRADVTADGYINVFDLLAVKNRLNTTVTSCP